MRVCAIAIDHGVNVMSSLAQWSIIFGAAVVMSGAIMAWARWDIARWARAHPEV
jgi:hypothetical protein